MRLRYRFLFFTLARFTAAVGADAEDTQEVLLDLEAVLGGHSVLNGFEFGGVEFDDLATLHADHVVVVLVLVIMLVVRPPITEANFARESCLGQKLERAIDGGLADGRVLRLHQPVKVFAGEMFLRAYKNFQDQVALRRALESGLLYVIEKYFLLFGHKFPVWLSSRN
ncbi:MAG: hypothetical protein QOH63_4013 [Acidobacteriota bacterium]|nr:hypothetical protein [Acidobacteriota bacterium]